MSDPIAPDALREAVARAIISTSAPLGLDRYLYGHDADILADAVLAVVAKHRDAEVERLQRSVGYWRERCCGECDAKVAQARIARARYALLTVTGKSEALAILEGRDG